MTKEIRLTPNDPSDDAIWALVPVKSLARSKQRLKQRVGQDRPDLTAAMLADVLEALANSEEITRVAVVTADSRVSGIAVDKGALVVDEVEPGGMNEALELGVANIARRGGRTIVIVPADIPLATGAELDRMIRELRDVPGAGIADLTGIGPSKDRGGTNFLCFDAGRPLSLMYGPGSYERHTGCAIEQGSRPVPLHSPLVSLDLDEADDLDEFIAFCIANPAFRKTGTWQLLQERGYAPRVGRAREPGAGLPRESRPATWEAPARAAVLEMAGEDDLSGLCRRARELRDQGHGGIVTYSRKVFIPLTRLCRDFCHYCTFATTPKHLPSPYLSIDEVLEIARQGRALGCKEALFTLGEKPELRHEAARRALDEMGFESTLEYVAHAAGRVLDETGLLPHINAGCMDPGEIAILRPVSASMGIMLESVSERLCEKGQVHYGSPDKHPAVRLQTLADAGKANVPFTTGILIGIGETREERLDSLLAIRDLHRRYGHIQEVIVQNFVPKADTKMAGVAPPDTDDLQWTIAMARIIFGPRMSIQAPPNLSPGQLQPLIDAGINDWGGVSPLTPDHVNPESPWPELDALSRETARAGKLLQERLTVYPGYATRPGRWLDARLEAPVLKLSDATGLAREDGWLSGQTVELPEGFMVSRPPAHGNLRRAPVSDAVRAVLDSATAGERPLRIDEITRLFEARGRDFEAVCEAADQLRKAVCGDAVSYVINRNINYTNICTYRCKFCAFAKGRKNTPASDAPYLKPPDEVARLATEAWRRGATEVCLQGGIHPKFTGQTYLDICSAVHSALPQMHIHAFSPLEVTHGAESLGVPVPEFLAELKNAGLKTLPGTAAEILSDDVRSVICHDKINSQQWLNVVEAAHELGLATTATIMFGHVDRYHHWAVHLLRILDLQQRSLGITEFVPLPFVAQEAPIYRRGQSRRGPTLREAVLMHAVSRLVLSPHVSNIQTSWVKMGLEGAALCLQSGANDLGGTLMNESITRAAGASHGQEMTPATLREVIRSCGRLPYQRNTFYEPLAGRSCESADEVNVLGCAYTDLYGSPLRDFPSQMATGPSARYPASIPRRS